MKTKKLKHLTKLDLHAFAPYSLERTISKYTRYGTEWYFMTPFEIFTQGIMWTGFSFHDKSVGLKIKTKGSTTESKVLVEVFAKGKLPHNTIEEAKRILEGCLGVNDDISEFYALRQKYSFLSYAQADLYGMRLAQFPDLFSAVILAITLQRASYGRTERMIRLLHEHFGERIEFDGKRIILCPSAKTLLDSSEAELREKCKVGYRAKYLKAAAAAITKGELPNLRDLEKLPAERARDILMRINGIGEYASDVILPQHSFPVDSWSAKIFCQLFRMPITEGGVKFSAIKEYAHNKFGKWQGYVYDYLINDIEELARIYNMELE